MRVVIAPDKFAGTLTAGEAAEAFGAGWGAARPSDSLRLAPMSDGGPGFCAVLASALPAARQVPVVTTDPLGRPVPATVLLHAGSAYIESAQAVGLHLLRELERDPEVTTSAGVAPLLELAIHTGADRIVVGLGGSATNDGGRGMIEALQAGAEGAELLVRLRARTLVVATDVDNPLLGLTGATAVFAPQKGADRHAVARLEGRMQAWAAAVPGFLDLAGVPGAGAAGGLGAALMWLGGRTSSGAALVAAAVGLDRFVEEADLVVTGEGTYDSTSLRGKVVGAVAAAAQQAGVPCVVVAGQITVGRREAAAHGVDDMTALADAAGSVAAAKADPQRWLRAAAAGLAAGWGPA